MSEIRLTWLNPDSLEFPPLELAFHDPNGLLAAGGDLQPQRLLRAYQLGIFPWYNEDEPILWWSPDPRCVIRPENVKVSRSLKKRIKSGCYEITFNHCFEDVIEACSQPRINSNGEESGTWISAEMKQAYLNLHELGYAHSVECWQAKHLVGGLYGIAIGKVFFGESMFSRATDASKVAFVSLCRELEQQGFQLIDGQVYSPHLITLGFELVKRDEFRSVLDQYCIAGKRLNLPN